MVCMVDEKYARSKYCVNELTMAQSCDLQLYPILLGSMAFAALPPGLRYGLSTTNCVPFPQSANKPDATQVLQLHHSMHTGGGGKTAVPQRRNTAAHPAQRDASGAAATTTGASDIGTTAATVTPMGAHGSAMAPIPVQAPTLPDHFTLRTEEEALVLDVLLGRTDVGKECKTLRNGR